MTKLIHFIIVEDVERQREYLKSWLKKTRPNLKYVADFSNHLDAYHFLLSKEGPSVNLIFLDIELPGKRDGLNLLELLHGKLKQPPKVIIISGNDYLLDTFEQIYPVSGYIQKPIEDEKLNKAIDKVELELPNMLPLSPTKANIEFIEFGGMIIPLKDIMFFDSNNSDKTLHRQNGATITDRISMNDLEKKLPEGVFMRVHESFIVNLDHNLLYSIDKKRTVYTMKCPQSGQQYSIPISQRYRYKFDGI